MARKPKNGIPTSATLPGDPTREPIVRNKFLQKLPCRVDGPALITLAEGMALCFEELATAEEARANDMRDHKQKISGIKERMNELAKGVRSHTEIREVECITRLTATNAVEIVRMDTGEVIETRAADAEDLQDELPLQEVAENGRMQDVIEAKGEPELFPEPEGAIDNPAGLLEGKAAKWSTGENPKPLDA